MENILILGSRCYKNGDATGVCSRNLLDCYREKGYNAFLLGYSDNVEEDGTDNKKDEYEFEYINNKKEYNKIEKRLKSLKRIFVPDLNNELINIYFENACKVIEENDINVVIGIMFPLEAIVVLKKIKEKYPHIKTVDYEVDSFVDVTDYTSRLSKYHIKAQCGFVKKLYKKIDFLLIMKVHYNVHSKVFSEFSNKMYMMDIPFLCKEIKPTNLTKDTFDIYYTGYLDKDNYSPKPLFDLMSLNKDKTNWRLHFISRGNCEEWIEEESKSDKRIIKRGRVSQEELNNSLANADLLVSVEYKEKPASIPSKVISYFSSCKPIIHFYSGKYKYFENEYINRYPKAICITNNINEEINKKILEFIDNDVEIEYEDVYQSFYMNTPEYSIDLIQKLINK